MSDDAHEVWTCITCGSPCDPCQCDCEHVENNGHCVRCAKDLGLIHPEPAPTFEESDR